MSSALILLTGHREAPYLIDYIRGYSTTLPIIHATDLEDLERECLPGRVLIAFCTAVIVPAALLDRLGRPAFNFHPGPPTYPGRHPESFAAYDGVIRFGATAHVMAPRVDEGPIVGVEWFDVPPETGQMMLADLAFPGNPAAIRPAGADHGAVVPTPEADRRTLVRPEDEPARL